MENKAAKEFWKQPIQEKGSFTPESQAATAPSFVTTAETTTLTAKYNGTVLQFIDTTSNNNELDIQDAHPTDPLSDVVNKKLGNGLNVWYLYRTTPVLDDQTPSFIVPAVELAAEAAEKQSEATTTTTTTAQEETDKNKESTTTTPSSTTDNQEDIVNLYLYARIIPVRGASGTASYVIYSTVKGIDADCRESGAGFLWKDMYKVIKIPQFQYQALILDVSEYSNKIVGKSQQTSALDLRPTFTLAAGVDVPAVIASCVPLLPDASKVWLGASLASDLSGMLAAAL